MGARISNQDLDFPRRRRATLRKASDLPGDDRETTSIFTRAGRFIFPREWGRDPFYTFLPRERNEGFGGVNAFVGLLTYAWRPGTKIEAGYGHYYVPDVRDARLNKYAFPAYRQLNLSATYPFSGGFEGLRVQALYVWKGALGDTYGQDRYVFNKVDMHLLNLVVNYEF